MIGLEAIVPSDPAKILHMKLLSIPFFLKSNRSDEKIPPKMISLDTVAKDPKKKGLIPPVFS